jgi:hypothetical protein
MNPKLASMSLPSSCRSFGSGQPSQGAADVRWSIYESTTSRIARARAMRIEQFARSVTGSRSEQVDSRAHIILILRTRTEREHKPSSHHVLQDTTSLSTLENIADADGRSLWQQPKNDVDRVRKRLRCGHVARSAPDAERSPKGGTSSRCSSTWGCARR